MGQPPTPPRARQGTVPRYNANGGIPMSKSHSRMPRQHGQESSSVAQSQKPSGLKDYKAEIELKKSRVAELRTQISIREAFYRDQVASLKSRPESKYDDASVSSYDYENLLDDYCSENEKQSKDERDKIQQDRDAAELDDAIEQIDSLLRNESEYPAASTGKYLNSGYGTLKAQASIQSMKAENDASTPEASMLSESAQHGVNSEIKRQDRSFTGTTSQGGMAPAPSDPNYENPNLEKQLQSLVHGIHHHMDGITGRLTKSFEASNQCMVDQVLRDMESMSDTVKLIYARSFSQNSIIMVLQQKLDFVCGQIDALRDTMRQREESMQSVFEEEMSKLRCDLNLQGASSVPASDNNTPSRLPVPGARVQFAQNASETPGFKIKYLRTKRDPEGSKEKEAPTPKSVNKHAENSIQQHQSGEQNLLPPATPHRATSKNTGTFYPQRKASILKDPTQASSGSPKPKQVKLSLDSVSEGSQAEKTKKPVDSTTRGDGTKVPQKKGSMLFNFRRRKDNDNAATSSNSNAGSNNSTQQQSTASKFLRTPRRNKDISTKAASSDNLRKSAGSTVGFSSSRKGAPPVPPIPTDLLIENGKKLSPSVEGGGRLSPGSIHPSMRNKRQQEIVDERDRERARELSMQSSQTQSLQSSTGTGTAGQDLDLEQDGESSPFVSARSHRQMLRSSRSLHDFAEGGPSLASSSPSFARASPSPYFSDRSISSGQFFYELPRVESSPSGNLQSLASPQGYQRTTPYGERRPEGNWI